uniref:Uncharacterized protein n=1 Tax=Lotus japonicus TaxID=34305 RepID=I3S101_LOTJA|nr:unknown [Lotus japonicus]
MPSSSGRGELYTPVRPMHPNPNLETSRPWLPSFTRGISPIFVLLFSSPMFQLSHSPFFSSSNVCLLVWFGR